ncbi:MAG: multidrug effflux MFS transporter [Ilumatobacteraceae bacterium]
MIDDAAAPTSADVVVAGRPTAGRREFLALVTALMATSALAIDFSLPAFPDIRAEFGMSPDATTVGTLVTVFFLGMAVGPWFYGPLSDRYGRRPPLFIGLVLYVVSAVLAAIAPTWGLLVVARFVWGLGSASTRTLCMAMIRDRFEGDAMAHALSMIMAVFLLVPILAPSVSALLLTALPWRAVFWIPALVAALLMVWARRLPETHAAEHRRPFTWRAIGRAAREVVGHRQSMSYTLAVTFLLGVLYVYIAGSEVIVEDVYDHGRWFPLFFGAIGVLFAVSSLNNARLVRRLGLTALVRRMAVVGTGLAAVFVGVAVATGGRPNFIVFSVLVGLVVASVQGLITNCNTAALSPLAHVAGTAAAIVSTVSTAGGSLLASLANGSFNGSTMPFTVFVGAYVGLAALFVLFGATPSRRAGHTQ